VVDLILPGKGRRLVRLLAGRRGRPTLLRLTDGREVTAFNSVWGRDWGAEWEHLTLNLSPRVAGAEVRTVSAEQVVEARDLDGRLLHRRPAHEKGARPAPRPLIFSPVRELSRAG
jgi:hypothetical protein